MVKTDSLTDIVDCILNICAEKQLFNGEDCIVYSLDGDGGFAAVFDGCGGSGARKYPAFDNKTGAFVASRITGSAFLKWFKEYPADNVEILRKMIKGMLSGCKEPSGGQSRIMGTLSKEFPTTAAALRVGMQKRAVSLDWYWTGDSRVYMLGQFGLRQLSYDDLNGIDPMENLFKDGVLSNVISLNTDFVIHHGTVPVDLPCIVFAATDGCFGYLPTPMHFEYLLLETLDRSESFDSWERNLYLSLKDIAGDDFTLCGFSLGFEGFDSLRDQMQERKRMVFEKYIRGSENSDTDAQYSLWAEYKKDYLKLCNIK